MSRESDDLQQHRRALGEQLATFRQAAQLTQVQLARRTYFDRSRIAHLERGTARADQRFWTAADEAVDAKGALIRAYTELEAAKDALTAQERARELAAVRARADRFRAANSTESSTVAPTNDPTMLDRRTILRGAAAAALVLHEAEMLRHQFTTDVDNAAMAGASLDDWEHTACQYGLAFRYRSAASLLVDLTADFAELRRLLEGRRAILVPTRLTRVMAQLAGLMCATLLRLDHHAEARNWARTAKVVASEAGDSQLHAWVLGQEAYSHYYSGNFAEAAYIAAHAQHVANHGPCTPVALAAALEARVHGKFGRTKEARVALERAERAVSGMAAQPYAPSAFDYGEAKLHFHTGSTYTYLGMTAEARAAQKRALAQCPTGDYFDRALIMLDHADCFAKDTDIPAAAEWVRRALHSVSAEQRNPLIDNRARQVLGRMSVTAPKLPAVRELREILEVSQ